MPEAASLPRWVIPACRLWQRPAAQGFCLSGIWGGLRVLVYANPDRRSATDAEYILCVSAPRLPPNAANTKETD